MGRKSNKEGIYIWLIRFAVQQKLTQHCKATIIKIKEKQIQGQNKRNNKKQGVINRQTW